MIPEVGAPTMTRPERRALLLQIVNGESWDPRTIVRHLGDDQRAALIAVRDCEVIWKGTLMADRVQEMFEAGLVDLVAGCRLTDAGIAVGALL